MQFTIKKCKSFKERFLGMMFIKEKKEIGYYFHHCHSIHTFFCYFPLDIVLLDKKDNIIEIKKNIKPWRIYFFKCYSILEIPSGKMPITIKDYIKNMNKKS